MWPEVIRRGQMIRGWWNSLSGRDKIAVAMEVTIAAAATIYAGISLCHLSALRESNRISREALIAVQRAYVSLKTIEAVGTRDAQGKVISWQFFPQWENSGTTPTKTLRQHANAKALREPISDDFDFQDAGLNVNSPDLLAAKATIFTGPLTIRADVLAEVRDGTRHLYFWGWVAYTDVFEDSNPHLTEFCNELTISEGDITTGEKVGFLHVSCGTHNCAEEECQDYAEVTKRLEGE